MTTMENTVKTLSHIAQVLSDGIDNVHYLFRNKRVRVPISSLITATGERTIMTAEKDCVIVSAKIYPDNALTADNTNYATLTIGSADGAGGAVTAFDAMTTEITGTGDWVQGAPESFTIVEATDTLDEGEALMFVTAKAAAGIAVEGVLEVEYRLV